MEFQWKVTFIGLSAILMHVFQVYVQVGVQIFFTRIFHYNKMINVILPYLLLDWILRLIGGSQMHENYGGYLR